MRARTSGRIWREALNTHAGELRKASSGLDAKFRATRCPILREDRAAWTSETISGYRLSEADIFQSRMTS